MNMYKIKCFMASVVLFVHFTLTEQCRRKIFGYDVNIFHSTPSKVPLRERFPGYDPEAYMDARALIESKGIPYESHTVETDDGYLLTVKRLARPNSTQQYPVLLMHGLLSSCESFLLNRRDQSLAYILYDRGFDVWLGNVRGTKYSRNHTSLDPESKEFWDWSFDEIGRFDVPAMIYHVLKVTGKTKINYIGYSQGAMVLFSSVIQHQRWYQTESTIGSKIKNFFAMAPAVYIEHSWSKSSKGYLTYLESFNIESGKYSHNEFAPWLLKDWIINKCLWWKTFCARTLIHRVSGWSEEGNFNASRLSVYLLHEPSGTSTKNIQHWIQTERRSRNVTGITYFDYGSRSSNLKRYHRLQTPEYNFNRYFGVKTHIYCGDKDMLVTLTDCQRLTDIVEGVNNVTVVEGFAHIDFVYSTNANVKVYEQIINHMWENEESRESLDIDSDLDSFSPIKFLSFFNIFSKNEKIL